MGSRVALIADNHFLFDNEQHFFVNGTYTKHYLERFTTNFDELVVIGRGHLSNNKDEIMGLHETGGDNVFFCILPDFNGIKNFFKLKRELRHIIDRALENVDAIFVRMPCILMNLSIECAHKKRIPIMIDVGADPAETYLSSSPTIQERIISCYMKNKCKRICKNANGVSYVTKKTLQNKYPCSSIIYGESTDHFTATISNVDLTDAFYYENRDYKSKDTWKLIHISNNICLNSSKGHNECIQILSKLINDGFNVSLTFMGGGNGRNELMEYAGKLGVQNAIHFTGRVVSRDAYREILLNHDLLVFPSYTEGLPRALIESMATGMVCLASNVGGIPDLLDEHDIFNYEDITGFTNRIESLINNVALLNDISKRNYYVSKEYSNTVLKNEYDLYYEKVRRLIDVYNNKKVRK